MIHTYSVLKGYQSIMGLFPMRLALAIAMATIKPIPEEELALYGVKSTDRLWNCQLIVHLLCVFLSILQFNESRFKPLEIVVQFGSVITVTFLIVVYFAQF